MEHFILECPNYKVQKKELRKTMGAWKIRIDKLLGGYKATHTHDGIHQGN